MRISDWSSDVCSSDLGAEHQLELVGGGTGGGAAVDRQDDAGDLGGALAGQEDGRVGNVVDHALAGQGLRELQHRVHVVARHRSEEHTSELQSLMRNSYAVFCLKKNKKNNKHHN